LSKADPTVILTAQRSIDLWLLTLAYAVAVANQF